MALQENLRSYQERVVLKALASMEQLVRLSRQLDKKEATSNFQSLIEKLKSDKFNLAVVGRFKNGKSTFANALLGPPTNGRILNGDKGPMPTSRVPCTAVLTYVRHAERPSVKALHMHTKTDEDWTFDKYLVEGKVQADDTNNDAFKNIKSFVVGYPSPLLKEGLVLVDTPGTDDVPERTRIARDAIKNADAAIVVYSSNHPAGEAEMAFVDNQLVGTVSKVYTVVNMFFEADDEFMRVAWNRLVPEQFRKPYNPNRFHEYGIYFIDALKAFRGKQANDVALQQDSGLLAFEQAVATFLTRERGKAHLLSSVFPAANSAKQLAEEIGRQQTLLNADAEQFRQVLETLRPKLAELKKKPDEVRRLFNYYENQLTSKLKTSYETFLLDLPEQIANHMLEVEIPILKETGAMLMRRKECEEAAKAVAEEFVDQHFKQWQEGEAKKIVSTTMHDMAQDLEAIFGSIKKKVDSIDLELNKILPFDDSISTGSKWDQILGVAYGIIFLDPVVGFGGKSMGWKGITSSLVGRLVIALGIGMFLTGPLGIAAIAILGSLYSLIIGQERADERTRNRIADQYAKIIGENRARMLLELEQSIIENFAELTVPILNLIQQQIDQDLEGIEQMARDNERGQAEKLTLIRTLERAKADVLDQHKMLSEIHLNI